jgi:hypothetical protein
VRKIFQKLISRRRTKKTPIILARADEFPTATVDNFVDYWPRCRRDQPRMLIPANRLTKRQKNSFVISWFQKFQILEIGTAGPKGDKSGGESLLNWVSFEEHR